MNTRPWWFVDFAVRCGVDVCRMAYDDAQGEADRTASMQYKVGATCVFPYYDFFAMQPLLREGSLSWGRWWKETAAGSATGRLLGRSAAGRRGLHARHAICAAQPAASTALRRTLNEPVRSNAGASA